MLSNIFKFIQNNLIKLLFFNTLIYLIEREEYIRGNA